MRSAMINAVVALCVLITGCTVTNLIYVSDPETHTYTTKANAGVLEGGADGATRAATQVATQYCAASHKPIKIVAVRIHEMGPRFISEVSFQCPEEISPAQRGS